MVEDETLPPQEEDDNLPEDREILLDQLRQLAGRPGPAAGLLRAGHQWLLGELSIADFKARAVEFESGLQADLDDPLLISQLDRLEEGLQDDSPEEVLYALLGLGFQL